jgi:GNAT superfamily N-acetyltransferase
VTEAGFRVATLVAHLARRDAIPPLPVRHPTDDDRVELPHVMLDAYRGGFDEPDMTLDDTRGYVRRFFEGGAATPLLECSFVALDEGRIVATALVCLDDGRPLLARAYTVPSWRNHGLARALIQLSMNALLDRGESALALFVKVGNVPAERLYASMGFAFESGEA